VIGATGLVPMYGLGESQTSVLSTFVAMSDPVLQTRTPTGKVFGPALTLLESSPITFQLIGSIVSTGAPTAAVPPVTDTSAMHASPTSAAATRPVTAQLRCRAR
jgi:hypothetical protein